MRFQWWETKSTVVIVHKHVLQSLSEANTVWDASCQFKCSVLVQNPLLAEREQFDFFWDARLWKKIFDMVEPLKQEILSPIIQHC